MEFERTINSQAERKRRIATLGALLAATAASLFYNSAVTTIIPDNASTLPAAVHSAEEMPLAMSSLQTLEVKGRAPKTGYTRDKFGGGWADIGGCNMRDYILARDMHDEKLRSDTDCDVLSGLLNDPYTGRTIYFDRNDSSAVQIEHIVAISDAWQKGAQELSQEERIRLYNDPLELIAVDGPANGQKGDADAATWLPPNKEYRCRYIARQIAVKAKYRLWVTPAEHEAMLRVLTTCPDQRLPSVQQQA